jgi:hypothetical protein
MDTKINLTIDSEINFYFYLINLYSCEDSDVNYEFREKNKSFRSEEFFDIFENMENPFIKDFLGINRVENKSKELIELEKSNFLEIWPKMEKNATKLKKMINERMGEIEESIDKIKKMINIPILYNKYNVHIIPSLKQHGKQDNKNFVYIGIKEDLKNFEDYKFIIVHELTHVLLRQFMNKYYFKYGYKDELHLKEEALINFLYFKTLPENVRKKLLPQWLYLMGGEHYEVFCNLIELEPYIDKSLDLFMEKALSKVGIE